MELFITALLVSGSCWLWAQRSRQRPLLAHVHGFRHGNPKAPRVIDLPPGSWRRL
jgi:hypothetical protein